MNLKIYSRNVILLFLFSISLGIQMPVWAKSSSYASSNILVDKAVKDFPEKNKSHPDVFDLVSHGRPGQLLLDSKWLDAVGIAAYLQARNLLNPDNAANYKFTGPVGTNGLDNSLEAVADNNIVNYSATYTFYAYTKVIKACIDLDGDGILDVKDVDDDNDGIMDAVESPTCFYTAGEAARIVGVTSDMNPYDQVNYTIDKSFDNNVNTHSAFVPNQSMVGKTLWEITPSTPIPLSSVNFDMAGANISFDNSSTFKLQGFNGAAWIDLGLPLANTSNADFSLFNTLDTVTIFRKFRVLGVAGTVWVSEVNELSLTVPSSYNPSINTKPVCNSDIDGDNLVNYDDTDSDGDGCSDALEGNATTINTPNYQFSGPVGTNGLVNSLETAPDNNIVNYQSTYFAYANSAAIQSCKDSDNDGIVDIKDIDADNQQRYDLSCCL